ncbi:MAG: hypothetical protein HYZ86_02020 [Candidatus Omnitrophica bacterium]|nr:hypothetical protein [Candidatus Omnitrophota bacterium]
MVSLQNWLVCIATIVIAVSSVFTWRVYQKLADITKDSLNEMKESSKILKEQVALFRDQLSLFDEYLTLIFVVEREKGSGDTPRHSQIARVLDGRPE